MGCDLVAVDATCCRLMQLDPEKVAYLVLGNRKKLGRLAEKQIQQVGETIAEQGAAVRHGGAFQAAVDGAARSGHGRSLSADRSPHYTPKTTYDTPFSSPQ